MVSICAHRANITHRGADIPFRSPDSSPNLIALIPLHRWRARQAVPSVAGNGGLYRDTRGFQITHFIGHDCIWRIMLRTLLA
jgi:hypothetical protein